MSVMTTRDVSETSSTPEAPCRKRIRLRGGAQSRCRGPASAGFDGDEAIEFTKAMEGIDTIPGPTADDREAVSA